MTNTNRESPPVPMITALREGTGKQAFIVEFQEVVLAVYYHRQPPENGIGFWSWKKFSDAMAETFGHAWYSPIEFRVNDVDKQVADWGAETIEPEFIRDLYEIRYREYHDRNYIDRDVDLNLIHVAYNGMENN